MAHESILRRKRGPYKGRTALRPRPRRIVRSHLVLVLPPSCSSCLGLGFNATDAGGHVPALGQDKHSILFLPFFRDFLFLNKGLTV